MVKEMKYIFNNPDVSWFTRWNTITKDVLEIGKAECLHFNDMKNGKQLYKHVWRFYCNFGSASKSHFIGSSLSFVARFKATI